MKYLLDCENVQTTLNSISRLYGINENDISDYLKGIDLENYFLENELYREEQIKDTLIRLFGNEFAELEKTPDLIYWFHGTRILKNEGLEEGILPLGRVIYKIWDSLFAIFSDTHHQEKLKKLRAKGLQSSHYNNRLSGNRDSGPYALLVKEARFGSKELWPHNYLKIPEIIEDICSSYSDEYGESIIEDVIYSLVPCIVKIKSIKNMGKWHVNTALYYLYHKLNNMSLNMDCNTCYDAENKTIPVSDIVKIEFLE